MKTSELTELNEYFDRLISATKDGKIDWTKANPTTFVWTTIRSPRPSKVSLQRVDRTALRADDRGAFVGQKVMRSYVFQALDGNYPRFSIDGTEEGGLNEKLEILFEAISNSMARKGLDFLKALLPPLAQ